jgi:hypothetical protein
MAKQRLYEDLSGRKYGKLLVIKRSEINKGGIYWECECDCGNQLNIRGNHLKEGQHSCVKCMKHDYAYTHGLHGHPSYRTWVMMRQRCLNPNAIGYKNYGGRGIKICKRWNDFENFAKDVGVPPSSKHTLDRFPNKNGDYEPSNFRWATWKEQQRNKRDNKTVSYKGETKTVAEWSDITGIEYSTIHRRLSNEWKLDDVFNRAVREVERVISFNGDSLTIKQWSKKLGVSKSTLNSRLYKGWPLDKVFYK